MTCPYAFMLGIPGQGVHATRIFGLALNDILMTIIGAFLFSYLFDIKFIYVFAFLFVLGEILHYIFGTQTAFLTMIGVKTQC